MLKKSNLMAAVGLCLGGNGASAAQFQMTFMDFPGAQNSTVVGTFDTTAQTGTITSGTTPFFGHAWTGTLVFGVDNTGTSTITGSWSYSSASGSSATGTYTYTLAPGQSAMGILFDWNTSSGIPVLNVVGADGSGVDIDGDGTLGTLMAAGPFVGSPVGFAGRLIGGAVLANNINLQATTGVSTTWVPDFTPPTLTGVSCAITTPPTAGTATVASDCSSGTFTGTANDSFQYEVTNSAGSSTGTVTVTVGASSPPAAVPDVVGVTLGSPTVLDLLANDDDADGDLDPATVTIVTPPSNGGVVVDPVSGAVTYTDTLAAGVCGGTDSFTYTVADSTPSTSNTATVSVTIGSTAPCSEDSTFTAGASDTSDGVMDGRVSAADLASVGIGTDSGVDQQCIGGCFDYSLAPASGTTATVILPLSQPIPNRSRLRKWNGTAWVDFDLSDSIATASSVNGVCPASGYTSNLTQGDDCIQLTLTDGGPNDSDGAANGTIVDPVGVGRDVLEAAQTGLGSGTGCSIAAGDVKASRHFDWALLLGFLGWLGMRRRSRS